MEKNKILIVEDTQIFARQIEEHLRQKNYDIVDVVDTGKKALEATKKYKPDLVLMDIVLKGAQDGIDVANKIYILYHIPIIYLTGHKDDTYLERAKRSAPFYGYIFKPTDQDTLHSAIQAALTKHAAEKNNIENEKKYRALFKYMPDAFFYLRLTYDTQKNVSDALCVEVNLAFLQLTQKDISDFLGRKLSEIFPDLDHLRKDWRKILEQIVITKKSKTGRLHLKSPDQWFYIFGYCPDRQHVAIMVHDVTKEIRAEHEIKASEEKYRALYENSNDAIIIFSNRAFIDCNRAALRMFGYDKKEFLTKNPFYFSSRDQLDVHPMLEPGKNIQQAFEEGEDRFEWQFRRKNDELFTADVLLSRFAEKGEKLLQATIRDISEKKAFEAMLKNNIAFFSVLIEKIPNPVFYTNRQGYYEGCNTYFAEKILGTSKEHIVGRTLGDFPGVVAPHLFEIYNRHDAALMQGKALISYEAEIKCADKMRRNFIINKAVYTNPYNKEQGIIGVMIDITERKKIERELLEKEERYKNLFSSIDSLLIGTSLNDKITHWNITAEKIFGLSSAEVIGKPIIGLRISWEWDKLYIGIAECISDRTQVSLSDVSYTSKEGKQGLLGIKINPIIDINGILKGFLIFGQDITERRIMESQLLQDQKLKSIGELAAGIAHEINTPTQYINDNTYFLKDAFADIAVMCDRVNELILRHTREEPIDELIREIHAYMKEKDVDYLHEEIPKAIGQSLEGLKRVSDIIKSMKSFSHPGQKKKIYLDINKALTDTITIARNEWKYIADVKTDFDESNPEVFALPAEINQVFLNIIVNAAHAIESAIDNKQIERGIITVQTRVVDTSVEVVIRDNGIGIPEDIKDRIFDHFFTTKEVGKGTGQGLALAHAIIVEKYKGKITVDTKEGEGTAFIIHLPLNFENIVGE